MVERPIEPQNFTGRGELAAGIQLAAAGITVGVMTVPVIPDLNEHQLPDLFSAAVASSAALLFED